MDPTFLALDAATLQRLPAGLLGRLLSTPPRTQPAWLETARLADDAACALSGAHGTLTMKRVLLRVNGAGELEVLAGEGEGEVRIGMAECGGSRITRALPSLPQPSARRHWQDHASYRRGSIGGGREG